MNLVRTLSSWVDQRWSWLLLCVSALSLEACALYFQYVLKLDPCIMCVYQRLAVFGLALAGLLPAVSNNPINRIIAFICWGVAAIWGFILAQEHMGLISNSNPFFASCEFVPNFPTWLQLHQWLPSIFAATGDCGDIDWSFVGLNMAEWMAIVFAIYSLLLVLVLGSRLIAKRRL